RVSRKLSSGASAFGNSYWREKRVHGLKPWPISAASAPVRNLTIDVLPLCVLPNSQKMGTGLCSRTLSSRDLSSASSRARRFGHPRLSRFSMLARQDSRSMPLHFTLLAAAGPHIWTCLDRPAPSLLSHIVLIWIAPERIPEEAGMEEPSHRVRSRLERAIDL